MFLRATKIVLFFLCIPLYAEILPEDILPELDIILCQLPKNAPQIAIHKERVLEAKGYETSSLAGYLPHIRSEFNYNHNIEKRPDVKGTKTQNGIDGRIFLTQPIYHWGSRKAERDIAKLRTDSARLYYKESLRHIINETRRVYLHIYTQKISLKLAQENIHLCEQNIDEVRRKKELGTATSMDLQESELRMKEAQQMILVLKNDIQHHENYLSEITSFKCTINPSLSIDEVSKKIHLLIKKNLDFEGNFQSERRRILCNELDTEKANYIKIRAQQLPSFDFTTGYFRDRVDGPDNTGSIYRDNFYGGIRGSWNIFDGRLSEGQKLASRARQRRLIQEIKEEDLRQKTRTSQVFGALTSAQEELKLQEARVQIAEAKLATHKDLLDQKVITMQTYLNEKRHHDEAKLNQLRSMTIFLSEWSKLVSYSENDRTLNHLLK